MAFSARLSGSFRYLPISITGPKTRTELSVGFSAIDYVVLAAYLVGITAFGTLFRRSQRTIKDYFLGARNTSWIVISLSIVATETSTLTLIGVPALSYASSPQPEIGSS